LSCFILRFEIVDGYRVWSHSGKSRPLLCICPTSARFLPTLRAYGQQAFPLLGPPEKDLGRPLKRYRRRDYTTVSEISDSDDDSKSSSVDSETDTSDTNTSDISDSDTNGPRTENAWRYKYIVRRRLDSQGRRIAKRRWKSTWELESEIAGLFISLPSI
jgi:hypothetical protein